jgi:hypothetical protein
LSLAKSISDFFIKFDLVNFCDRILPKSRLHKLSNGECFLALCLCGFSVYDKALYGVSEILKGLPINEFFKGAKEYVYFNDDVLGRFMEAVQNFGSSEFFLLTISHIRDILLKSQGKEHPGGITGHGPHSTHHVRHEPYETPEHNNAIRLFACKLLEKVMGEGQKSLNLDEYYDAKTKEVFLKCLLSLSAGLEKEDGFHLIFNESQYDPSLMDLKATWICPVPRFHESLGQFRSLQIPAEKPLGKSQYTLHEVKSTLGNEPINFIIIQPYLGAKEKDQLIKKHQNQVKRLAQEDLRKLCKEGFETENEAWEASQRFLQKWEIFFFDKILVEPKAKHIPGKLGRPKLHEKRSKLFHIKTNLIINEEAYAREKIALGRVFLATNDFTTPKEKLVAIWEDSKPFQRPFHYLEDKFFLTSNFKIRKEKRRDGFSSILSLMVIMQSYLAVQ